MAVMGTYAYVTDGWNGLRILDVSDPTNPIEVGSYDTLEYAGNVVVSGTYAYLSEGSTDLHILHIGDPANPQEVGRYRNSSEASGGIIVSGDHIYLSDGTSGFLILRLHIFHAYLPLTMRNF